jgi:23S rRNA (adenine2503-C2)-methyltransferase
VPCKINLIPFNAYPGTAYSRSPERAVARFSEILFEQGYTVTVRRTRGEGIDAACGQLAGRVQDKTRRAERRAAVREGTARTLEAAR